MKLLQWIVVPLISARVVRAEEQFAIQEVDGIGSEFHTPEHIAEEFALTIGVHFTTSHAVAAARYANGTTKDIVRVAGDADYIDLMLRWASWRERYDRGERDLHCAPIYSIASYSIIDRYRCKLQAVERKARSFLDLPRSRNADIFTNFMTTVRKAIEKETGATVEDIALAYPKLDTFDWHDFADGLQRSGLKPNTPTRSGFPTFSYEEVNAAYAGIGDATCKGDGQVRTDCVAGHSFLLNFDSACLSVALIYSESVFPRAFLGYRGIHTRLGWWNLPIDVIPRAAFWAEVRIILSHIASALYGPPRRILLLGDHGADEEFLEVLKAVVWEKQQFDVSDMLNATKKEDVNWLAARGAAELAWQDRDRMSW